MTLWCVDEKFWEWNVWYMNIAFGFLLPVTSVTYTDAMWGVNIRDLMVNCDLCHAGSWWQDWYRPYHLSLEFTGKSCTFTYCLEPCVLLKRNRCFARFNYTSVDSVWKPSRLASPSRHRFLRRSLQMSLPKQSVPLVRSPPSPWGKESKMLFSDPSISLWRSSRHERPGAVCCVWQKINDSHVS